jgi:hypothetical protein
VAVNPFTMTRAHTFPEATPKSLANVFTIEEDTKDEQLKQFRKLILEGSYDLNIKVLKLMDSWLPFQLNPDRIHCGVNYKSLYRRYHCEIYYRLFEKFDSRKELRRCTKYTDVPAKVR